MNLLTILPAATVGRSVFTLIADTGLFAKTILLILFVISVISWAIIWDRTRLYLRLRKKGRLLRDALSREGLFTVLENARRYLPSVEGSILMETKRLLESKNKGRGTGPGVSGNEGGMAPGMSTRSFLDRRAIHEIAEMEKYLIFLSTTSSVSPFLGLLGTVWGIMGSFLSMGVQGTASIEVVGPGIAEALVTTIAGLGAAIPALVGYNLLVRHVHRQETRIDLLISRVVEQIEFVKPKQVSAETRPSYEEKPV